MPEFCRHAGAPSRKRNFQHLPLPDPSSATQPVSALTSINTEPLFPALQAKPWKTELGKGKQIYLHSDQIGGLVCVWRGEPSSSIECASGCVSQAVTYFLGYKVLEEGKTCTFNWGGNLEKRPEPIMKVSSLNLDTWAILKSLR